MDIKHAISTEGRDFSPLELPGSRSEEGDNVVADSPSSSNHGSDIGIVDGKPSDDRAWTGFGSDDVADSRARNEYEKARQKLLDDIEIAVDTGDTAEENRAKDQLIELESYMNQATRPGGQSRKLATGDPIEKGSRKEPAQEGRDRHHARGYSQ